MSKKIDFANPAADIAFGQMLLANLDGAFGSNEEHAAAAGCD
jgi:hypothetical protein